MRVMGILADVDQVVSISDAGTMSLDTKKGKQVDLTPKGAPRKLKSLLNLPDRKLFAVSDTLGNVMLYNNSGG